MFTDHLNDCKCFYIWRRQIIKTFVNGTKIHAQQLVMIAVKLRVISIDNQLIIVHLASMSIGSKGVNSPASIHQINAY